MNRLDWRKIKNRYLMVWLLAAGMLSVLAGCGREADVAPLESTEALTVETDNVTSSEPAEEILTKPVESPGNIADSETEEVWEPVVEEESNGQKQPERRVIENIIIGTDLHYLDPSLTDGGPRFREMVEYGDGKVVTYISEITEAFFDEVISLRPNALVLSGDLTLEGERISHEGLARQLYRVEKAGVPVLVIPGNHDINNRQAASYQGNQRLPAEFTTPEEFREIYRDFGYDEAISEDRRSLSYVYQLDENTRMLMLDTCQYQPVGKVGGAILSSTYEWIEQQMEAAWNEGMDVIPVAHHNLLDESEIYVDNCTIEHGEQLVDILEEWDVPVFLSGHLHVQHTKRSSDNMGVWEMVTASLATPVCQYGVLEYQGNGGFDYRTWSLDVEGWAKRNGVKNKDLLEFNSFKEPFLRKVFYHQSMASLEEIQELSREQKEQMSVLYAELNYYYYQGTAYQIRDQVKRDPVYQLWLEEGASSVLGDYVVYILEDAKRDYNRVTEE